LPDLGGIMLNPAGLRKYLLVFLLIMSRDSALAIEEHAACAGGALINGGNVFRHTVRSFVNRLYPRSLG
jgi:hypothetical protein